MVLDFSAVDNFDFTRKIVKKNWVKTRQNIGALSKLDKNLTVGHVSFTFLTISITYSDVTTVLSQMPLSLLCPSRGLP